jgi:hypothetical protein
MVPTAPVRETGSFEDLGAARVEMFDNAFERDVCDEAEVSGARRGLLGLRFELFSSLVQVDLLPPKPQGRATFRKLLHFHAKDAREKWQVASMLRTVSTK